MFSNCSNLVGGQGTAYGYNNRDHTYARIDGGTEAPGYFTYKNPSDIKAITMNGIINGNASVYDLGGRLLAAPQKGMNIIGGKKVYVK